MIEPGQHLYFCFAAKEFIMDVVCQKRPWQAWTVGICFVCSAVWTLCAKRRHSIYFVAAAELVLVYIDYTPLGHFYILPIRTWAQILPGWTTFYDPLDYTNINQIISDQSWKKNEFWVPLDVCTLYNSVSAPLYPFICKFSFMNSCKYFGVGRAFHLFC